MIRRLGYFRKRDFIPFIFRFTLNFMGIDFWAGFLRYTIQCSNSFVIVISFCYDRSQFFSFSFSLAVLKKGETITHATHICVLPVSWVHILNYIFSTLIFNIRCDSIRLIIEKKFRNMMKGDLSMVEQLKHSDSFP